MRTTRLWVLLTGALALLTVGLAPNAGADPVGSGSASAFGVSADLAGNGLVPATPTADVEAPPFGDDEDQTLVPVDAGPLAVNGTLTARAAVHQVSDLPSLIEQAPSQHAVDGPYNARAVGQIEDLELLPAALGEDPLIEADLVRAEAVAVCRAGTVEYSATSEIVNLGIGGEDPLSGPLNELLGQIEEALEPLADVADVQLNVVEITPTGASVDALVITLLSVIGDDPLVELRLGHAEVSGVACGDAADLPECSDGIDNDGDGLVDIDDPECHTDGDADNPDSYDPDHDDEGGEGSGDPGCADGVDNDGDGLVDIDDPDCHTDGDPTNPDSYDPDRDETGGQCADGQDNDGDGVTDADDPDCHTDGDATNPDSYDPTRQEGSSGGPLPGSFGGTGAADQLPETGTALATGAAALAALGGLGLLALRRRTGLA